MRIAHVTTVHRWDDGRIFERQARSLQRAGHEVYILAPGLAAKQIDGVDVLPLGIPKGRSDRMTRLVYEAKRCLERLQPDLVIVHDPELLRLIVSISFTDARPVCVYDAHEDYSAQMRDKEWLPKWLRGVLAAVLGRAEILAAVRADAVLAATPVIATRFPEAKTFVVLNRPTISDLPSLEGRMGTGNGDASESSTIVYVGDLREVRGARSLIDAMGLLAHRPAARLSIAGTISPKTLEDELSRSPGWTKVDLLGWLPRDEVNRLLERSDVGVIPFLPARNHIDSQPNKLFEYLVMGLPVVMSDFETWKGLADEVGARYETFSPGKPAELADALTRALMPSKSEERTLRADRARKHLAWEQISQEYVDTIETLWAGDAPND